MNALAPAPGIPSSTARRRVFISYARSDGREFVEKLISHLKLSDHNVWLDREGITAGAEYDAAIEQAIRNCDIFLYTLTRSSVRARSVCRDELELALNSGKRVVPLLIHEDAAKEIPLRALRLNWIDFTVNHEGGLEALRRCLLGDDSQMRQPRFGSVALDFGIEVERYLKEFSGRGWIIDEIERWLEASTAPKVFIVEGEPGVGKSAVAARLASRADVIAAHFCTNQNTRSLDPIEFVASFVNQLCIRLDGFDHAAKPFERCNSAADAWRACVVEPLRTLPNPPRLKLLIIDSLDEAATRAGETILDVLIKHVGDLPPWIRVVATTRPEPAIMERVRHLRVFRLEADATTNRRDVAEYVRRRLGDPFFVKQLGGDVDAAAERIQTVAAGNFLCARLLLDSLLEGSIPFSSLDRLSPGLAVFFTESFRRQFSDTDEYQRNVAPILSALAVSREPLPIPILSAVWTNRRRRETSDEVSSVMRRLRIYLREREIDGVASYSLFHKALTDWLSNASEAGEYAVRVAEGHRELAECIEQEYRRGIESMSDYAVHHVAAHCSEAGRWEELLKAVREGSLRLLEKWTEREPHEGKKCLAGLIKHLTRSGGDRLLAAGYATQLARIHSRLDELDEAEHWLRIALQRCKWRGRRIRAIAYHELGSLRMYQGDNKASEQFYRRALWLCELGWPRFQDEAAANLVALAVLSLGRYDYVRAGKCARRALEKARAAGDWPHTSAANRLLANVAKDELRFGEARAHLQAVAACANLKDLPFERAAGSHLQGWLEYQEAALENKSPAAADVSFQQTLLEAGRISHVAYRAGALLGLAQCGLLTESFEDAERRLQEAENILAGARHHEKLKVFAALARASLLLKRGEFNQAGHCFLEARENAHVLDERSREADAWTGMGAAEFHSGNVVRAEECWRNAEALAENCSPLRLKLTQKSITENRKGRKAAPL
jgi:tetratricopeptide (TPR) repeat protein